MDVANAEFQMVPEVRHRVFQITHEAGRSGVQHFDEEFRVVCRSSHLIALILTPLGYIDLPIAACGRRGWKMIRQLTRMCCMEHLLTPGDQLTLARRESLVKRK